jgi:hypothetical protein
LVIPGITETGNSDFVDNYDMVDGSNDDEYTLSEKMVHYVGGHVMPEHWVACKAVLVFHAGYTTSSKLPVMTKSSKLAACEY